MSPTAFKRAVLSVLIAGGALWLWQTSKEAPPGAATASSQSSPSADSPPAAAPAGAIPLAEPSQPTQTTPPAGEAPSAPAQATASNAAAAPQPAPSRETDKPPVAAAPANATPQNLAEAMRVQQDVGSLKFLLRDFRNALGGNPVGNNAEIVKALQGRNPKKLALKLWDGHRLNGDGELVDPWGSPYFFHQVSAKEMEIRCAGPDRVMWNKDDIAVQ